MRVVEGWECIRYLWNIRIGIVETMIFERRTLGCKTLSRKTHQNLKSSLASVTIKQGPRKTVTSRICGSPDPV